MTKLLKYIAPIFLLTLTVNGLAQEKGMYLYGRTIELSLLDSSESKVGEIPVEVYKGDSLLIEALSSGSGKYNCFLPFGDEYIVKYGKAPFVAKLVYFDLRNIGGKTVRKGFSLDLDMTIFKSDDPTIIMLHEEPVAKAAYSKKPDLIVFDSLYSQKHKAEVGRAMLSIRQKGKK